MINFIKNFITRKEQKIIGDSLFAVNSIKEEWQKFFKIDTYLIFDSADYFSNLIKTGRKESKIPWYFFWHHRLKLNLRNNLKKLNKFEKIIKSYNPDFITRKKREYKNLFEKESITLSDDQQTAIITDDKHNLVVAAAGSGKTEVLITRIAYLVKRASDTIRADRILALAFQKKAASEIKIRLQKEFKTDVKIETFHAFGLKIIQDFAKFKNTKVPTLDYRCNEDWKSQRFIKEIFNKEIKNNEELQKEYIYFMEHYGDRERIKSKEEFDNKETFYEYMQNLQYICLDGQLVKSEAERKIKNFFISHKINNCPVNLVYEQPAKWMKYVDENGDEHTPKPDFYFSDFDIYFEHWAINKEKKVPEWFSGDNPTKQYVKGMELKKKRFAENKKLLVETTHADFETDFFDKTIEEKFLEILRKKFPEKEKKHFIITPLSYSELVNKTWYECKEFVTKIDKYISRYITTAKTYRSSVPEIEKRLIKEKWSLRQKSFAKIANRIYAAYDIELAKNNTIDYQDMINFAVDYLRENEKFYLDMYDHILIDEYQDISAQRYELIKELMGKNKNCKLFCVGDDWQSIMGFAGSNLDYFINFDKYFPHSVKTNLIKNYRSTKIIVNAGAQIIKRNSSGQIKKQTISSSNSKKSEPIFIYSSLFPKESYVKYNKQIVEHCLNKIKEYHTTKNYPYSDFMILTRIGIDKNIYMNKPIEECSKKLKIPISFEKEGRPNCVRVMTVHKSKGLQARVVIILRTDEGLYGFPSSLENPDIFNPAIKNNDNCRKEEERRLFYVAITRAKESVIMYSQKCIESEYVTEIKNLSRQNKKICPKCNNSLIEKNGKNGKFWECSNYPNVDIPKI